MRLIPGDAEAGGGLRRAPCARWEREVHLAASDDVPSAVLPALERHLRDCPACREAAAAARQLRERCLQAAAGRSSHPEFPDLWGRVSAGLAEPKPPEPVEAIRWRRRPVLGGRPLLAALSLAAVVLGASWLVLHSHAGPENLRPRASGTGSIVGERWSQEWDAFVSGADGRGELMIDPFAPPIPNPEVIDF